MKVIVLVHHVKNVTVYHRKENAQGGGGAGEKRPVKDDLKKKSRFSMTISTTNQENKQGDRRRERWC